MRVAIFLVTLLVALPGAAQQYRFPIELPSSGTQPYVTAYRDHDTSGGLQDWNCGENTYNGHKGSDFGIGSWPVMDSGSRFVVAAAPGEVVFVNDGCFDHCSTADCNCGAGFGNYVKIAHADGKSTYYAHLMTGSILVSVGEQVSCGQHLGKVGSSGYSSGPHLHFEPRYSDNTSDDPFSGPCGGPTSFWVNQSAYEALPSDQCEAPPPVDVDDSKLLSETIPAGTVLSPNESFEKSWTIENSGTTSWTKPSFALVHESGDAFGAPATIELGDGETIGPTAQRTFTVTMTAPSTPGSYAGAFRMDHVGVAHFGAALHVEISVSGSGGGTATDGGGWGTGGAKIDAGTAKGGSSSQKTKVLGEDDGGCGCRVGPLPRAPSSIAAMLLGLAFFARRARIRR